MRIIPKLIGNDKWPAIERPLNEFDLIFYVRLDEWFSHRASNSRKGLLIWSKLISKKKNRNVREFEK